MTQSPSLTPHSPSVAIGEGSLRRLGALLEKLDAKRLFLVVDKPAYEHSGASETLEETLRSLDEATFFSGFELNPKIEDVVEGIASFRKTAPDAVVALGGGSALDMAKLISNCAVQDDEALDYVVGAKRLERPGPPLIAIPTTSGTGSEATHFAVAYVQGEKYSLAHPNLLPEYVIIDPELTYSLPAGSTAASGLDALCQSIESIWAVGATDESIQYGSEALQLCLGNLETVVRAPTHEARAAMARAAHLAGKAINISKTTAPHALSYAITTRYRIPHGCAVALTIGAFLDFNSHVDEESCTDPRGAEHVRQRIERIVRLMDCASIKEARERLEGIIFNTGSSVRLSDAGIAPGDVDWVARQVNGERMSNNPRKTDTPKLCSLLSTIL